MRIVHHVHMNNVLLKQRNCVTLQFSVNMQFALTHTVKKAINSLSKFTAFANPSLRVNK